MVLESRVQVSLRAVACVARLGEQRKVGQAQPGGQGPVSQGGALGMTGRHARVNEGAGEAGEQRETEQQDPFAPRQCPQTDVQG